MIAKLKPYPATRYSGVPWLGSVPTHWSLRRIKTLFDRRSEKGFPNEPLLTATQTKGVVRKEEYEPRTVLALKDLHLLKLVHVGDFVISLRSFQGGIEYARERGIISPAYTVLSPLDGTHHAYLAWLLKSQPFIDNLSLFVTGIRQGQDIDYERLARAYLPVPPLAEQAAIARSLDHVDRRIRRYVRAKQNLIALLDEYQQAVAHQAVTHGVRTSVKPKRTGNGWFPKLPAHWDVMPMRRVITRAVDGPHHSPEYLDRGIPFLSAGNIKADRWSLEDVKYISQKDYEVFCRRVKPATGDVLYTKGGTTGVARAVDQDYPFQVWVHIAVLKPRKSRILPRYLALTLNTLRCYEQSQLLTRGATNQDLGLGRMKEIVLPIPPLAEQSAIIEHVAEVENHLGRAVAMALREIELLWEYRTRLIADAVSGKVDVREAAARLTEEGAPN